MLFHFFSSFQHFEELLIGLIIGHLFLLSNPEFIIEYEESQWEPGRWKELARVPGNHHSAMLKLHGHMDYSFRISAVNEVGKGRPSKASDRYKTPASGPHYLPRSFYFYQ